MVRLMVADKFGAGELLSFRLFSNPFRSVKSVSSAFYLTILHLQSKENIVNTKTNKKGSNNKIQLNR